MDRFAILLRGSSRDCSRASSHLQAWDRAAAARRAGWNGPTAPPRRRSFGARKAPPAKRSTVLPPRASGNNTSAPARRWVLDDRTTEGSRATSSAPPQRRSAGDRHVSSATAWSYAVIRAACGTWSFIGPFVERLGHHVSAVGPVKPGDEVGIGPQPRLSSRAGPSLSGWIEPEPALPVRGPTLGRGGPVESRPCPARKTGSSSCPPGAGSGLSELCHPHDRAPRHEHHRSS
jgi:hypothetical protein